MNAAGPYVITRALRVVTEGESYGLRAAIEDEFFKFELVRNGAANPISVESDHVLMPAGAKLTITCSDANEYLFDNDVSTSNPTPSSYSNLEFLEAVDPSALGLSGATGTAVDNSVRFSFAENVKSFSITPTVDLKLSTVTICHGRRSSINA